MDNIKEKHRVVLIDDSLTECKKISQILTSEGYKVTYFDSAFLALEYIVRDKPDIIISDLIMPDMDGYEVCKFIKKTARTADIPVLLLTSMETTEAFVKGFEAGAFDFVRKDEDPKILTTRLKSCIEYHRILKEVKATNEKLEKALRERTLLLIKAKRQCFFAQFIQGIIHNLKNPLGAISGFAEVNTHYLDELAKQHDENIVAIIDKNNTHISQAADNIFDLIQSLLHKGKESISEDKEMINIKDFINKELAFYGANNFYSQKLSTQLNLGEGDITVQITSSILSQVFQNLVSNSLDAMQSVENPTMFINVGKDSHNFWLEVVDNGYGIEEHVMSKIYQPFFTTKTIEDLSNQSHSGTGLGLFICKEMIETLGGKIEVNSTPFVATSFKVILPLS